MRSVALVFYPLRSTRFLVTVGGAGSVCWMQEEAQ